MRNKQFFDSSAVVRWAALVVAICFIVGCGETVPEIVPLSVSVKTPYGKPINAVQVRFVPTSESLDGNFVGVGVTDSEGICEIALPGKTESSITLGEHKVLVLEPGASEEAVEAYMNGDPSLSLKEKKNRKNRPLPKKYERLFSTPLKYDITPNQARIDIVLE